MMSFLSLLLFFLAVFAVNRLNFFVLPTGKLRYANNSNYKNDVMIRKEVRSFQMSNFFALSLFSSCLCFYLPI